MLTAKGIQGQLELDGDWLTIKRKGAMAKMTQGLKGDKRVPVANITSVQFKAAGMTSGYIQFSLQGSAEAKGGVVQASRDENSVQFVKKQQPNFEAIRDAIEQYITGRTGRSAGGSASNASLADELKKLAELRDAGVLSAQEFEAQKSRLLG